MSTFSKIFAGVLLLVWTAAMAVDMHPSIEYDVPAPVHGIPLALLAPVFGIKLVKESNGGDKK